MAVLEKGLGSHPSTSALPLKVPYLVKRYISVNSSRLTDLPPISELLTDDTNADACAERNKTENQKGYFIR